MQIDEVYRGREQTYVKHLFLRRYLNRMAHIVGSWADEIVYVDGFSGPWQAKDEKLEDTSFSIAIRELHAAQRNLAKHNPKLRIRCIFIEKDAEAYSKLSDFTKVITEVSVRSIHGQFEDHISTIAAEIGSGFSLVFIDPTGWTGYPMEKLLPLLKLRGEVLVNFMFNFINLGVAHPETHSKGLDELFGGPGWAQAAQAADRETAIVDLYCSRLRNACPGRFVTSTRVINRAADRTWFYLVYSTRNWKGLEVFRDVEAKAAEVQDLLREGIQQDARVQRVGQLELFTPSQSGQVANRLEEHQRAAGEQARRVLLERLLPGLSFPYETVAAWCLETPLVRRPAVNDLLKDLQSDGIIRIENMKPRQQKPDVGCTIIRLVGGSG